MVIENKTIKIWGTAFSLIGDLIMSLPQLNYFKNQYPDSYNNFIIHKKISYCAPLFFNHPLIDRIKISDGWSDFGDNDYNIAKDCDIHTTSISLFNEKSCDEIKIDELAELCDKFYKHESFSIKNTISKFI